MTTRQVGFHKIFNDLPPSIQSLVQKAVEQTKPKEVILFGSRARGDNRPNSDYDIAVKGPLDEKGWTMFMLSLQESPVTLYPIDVVQYEKLGHDYYLNIKKDGKIIYG